MSKKAARSRRPRSAFTSEDPLTTLPDELKVLIVEQVGKPPTHYSPMDSFLAKELFRLRGMQDLRMLHPIFSRMPVAKSLLYDATSSVWAIQAARKIKDNINLDILETFLLDRPRKMEVLLYMKEREAFFAVRDVSGHDTTLMKRYLEHYKSRVQKHDVHLAEVGIYEKAAETEEETEEGEEE